MAIYYFDTSALVKLYITEKGTQWVDRVARSHDEHGTPLHVIVFSRIGIVETGAAIARRARTGDISREDQQILYQDFMKASAQSFTTVALIDEVIMLASGLTQQYVLHGYDAVHLATALAYNKQLVFARQPALIFVSADTALLQAAAAEGLTADNPNNHP